MSDRDDRDVDDLFGDLDEFFAPIEDVDWPEGEEEGRQEEPRRTDEGTSTEAPPEERGEGWAPSIDLPDEEELVGSAPEEPAEPRTEEPAAEAAALAEGTPPRDEEDAEAAELLGELEGTPVTPEPVDADRIEEATAEMSGEEWERLRGGLDEEPAAPEGPGGDEPAAAETPSEELGVDDLGQTRPRDPERAEVGPSDEDEASPFVDQVLEEEATFEPEEPAPPIPGQAPEPEAPEEVTSEDVEAAAQHFAGGLEPDEVERDLLADLEGGEDEELGEAAVLEPTPGEPTAVEPILPDTTAAPEADPFAGEAPPTWREPAAYEGDDEEEPPVTEETLPPPPGGRNLPAAAASGIILAVAAIALLAIGKGAFVVLAIGLVALGQGELYAVMRTRGFQPATAIGLLAGVLIMAGAYVHGDVAGQGESAVLFGLALGAILTVPWYMAAAPTARKGLLANAGATILGIVYVPVLVSFALILLAQPEIGTELFLTVIGLTVLYDVCAFGIGTVWGDRPLAPTISPRKSWEGAVGAAVVLVIVALIVVPSIDPFDAARAAGLALVISIAAPLGDLVESAIKRDLGVKDMGTLLPGHGGILDRIDAILFAAPAAYIFLRLVL